MKTIYIAGPMREIEAYNFPAFDEAEDALLERGWSVLSPATIDRSVGFDPKKDTVDKEFLDAAMERDVDAIVKYADAMAVLPGWEKSTGATAEVALARWKHIPVYRYPLMDLIDEDCILREALRITSGAREETYGPPEEDFARTAKMWSALKGVPFDARDVALFMCAVKMSRQTHSPHRDNWVDIAGYARCGSLCPVE